MSRLTAEKRKQLKKLAARPEQEIDFSDIPEMQSIPSDAVIGRFHQPGKETVTLRLDADVIAWLKASGRGYQTRINSILRGLMRLSRIS